jgi:hypothetical protein
MQCATMNMQLAYVCMRLFQLRADEAYSVSEMPVKWFLARINSNRKKLIERSCFCFLAVNTRPRGCLRLMRGAHGTHSSKVRVNTAHANLCSGTRGNIIRTIHGSLNSK